MTSQPEQKDFFTWWREDFAPTIMAARKALEPHIRKWQQISVALNKALTDFINEHRESIELWAKFAEIYPQFKPYVDNIVNGLSDPDFEVANDVVELAHIFESINLQEDVNSVSLLSVISGISFQKSLIELYENSQLSSGRKNLIEEALTLHNKSYFGGSVSLLYGLIEGVLTESFEKANYIVINSNKINPIDVSGNIKKNQNLTGLTPKLDHAISRQDQLSSYYSKIKAYELVNGDSEQTIPKTRNKILHGGSIDFNTEKRSAQLILWLYSALLHIQTLGLNNSMQPIANASAALRR